MEFTKHFLQTVVTYVDGEEVEIGTKVNEDGSTIKSKLTMRIAIRKGLTERRDGDQSSPDERLEYAILADKVWNSEFTPTSEEITIIKKRCKEYWLPEIALFIVRAIDPSSVGDKTIKNINKNSRK
jgi:hypothetical protein